MSITIDILKYITCIYKIQTSHFSTVSDYYYYLFYYHDYASLQRSSFPWKNILGFNNINKSTLGLIAWSYWKYIKILKLVLIGDELFYA